MTNNPKNKFKDYLSLTKLKIMIPVSLTGFTGYFVFDPHLSVRILLITTGILLLAISASVLNQIQEVKTDGIMERTRYRSLPGNRIKVQNAAIFFLIIFITGLIITFYAGNIKAVIIGLITIIWYNGVYTYCKRITAFAVVPGAITGALPPLIGWVAAGGGVWDKPVIFIGFLIFTAQIPHFWLLLLKYGSEYKKAGFPTLFDIFSRRQIYRLTFSWILGSVISALFLCYFGIIQNQLIIGILLVASIYIVWQFFDLLKTEPEMYNYRRYSIFLDSYLLLVLVLLISDRIIM